MVVATWKPLCHVLLVAVFLSAHAHGRITEEECNNVMSGGSVSRALDAEETMAVALLKNLMIHPESSQMLSRKMSAGAGASIAGPPCAQLDAWIYASDPESWSDREAIEMVTGGKSDATATAEQAPAFRVQAGEVYSEPINSFVINNGKNYFHTVNFGNGTLAPFLLSELHDQEMFRERYVTNAAKNRSWWVFVSLTQPWPSSKAVLEQIITRDFGWVCQYRQRGYKRFAWRAISNGVVIARYYYYAYEPVV